MPFNTIIVLLGFVAAIGILVKDGSLHYPLSTAVSSFHLSHACRDYNLFTV
jgi:hypothetical protein